MKPILFNKSATSFTSNGIGRLDCVSCVVTEARNGEYELEMEISIESQYSDAIEMNSIIVVRPAPGASLQAFRVYDIEKPINGLFRVCADHISYQLNYVTVMPFSVTASTGACASALAGLRTNSVGYSDHEGAYQFSFETNVTTVNSYTQTVPQTLRACLGGIAGSVLDQFGGEYEFDNYTVKLHAHRGLQDPAVTLRYGKDITDISQEENIANTITGIVPFWVDSEGNEIVTLPEKVVESSYASMYPFKRTVPYDFSADFENKPTESQLRTHALAYINKAGIGIPKVSIKVSFIDLSQTEEYKDIFALQSVRLCDVIGVHFDALGIDTTAKVVKVVYDCLKERYNSIEIGSARTNLATTINDTNASVVTLANNTTTNFNKISNELQEDIDNATAWLTGNDGVIRALKNADGEWTDLLCMSTTATATSGNVLRLNTNGIGFSSTGWNGTYTQAWTLDGRLVIGGTNVPSITVYDNQNNIIFKADANAMIWNADNSTMSADGTITMVGGSITMANGNQKVIIQDGSLYFYGGSTLVGEILTDTSHMGLLLRSYNSQSYALLDGEWLEFKSQYLRISDGSTTATGVSGSKTFVDDIEYSTYTFATDLHIDMVNMSASWTDVTLSVATNHYTDSVSHINGIRVS